MTCEIRVRNLGTIVDRFQFELHGHPGQWSLIEPATLSLFPDAEGSALGPGSSVVASFSHVWSPMSARPSGAEPGLAEVQAARAWG